MWVKLQVWPRLQMCPKHRYKFDFNRKRFKIAPVIWTFTFNTTINFIFYLCFVGKIMFYLVKVTCNLINL